MAAGFLRRFVRRTDGAIAPIFALAAIPLVVSVGAVVDFTNAYDKKTVVQDSMDSAALAAGKKIGSLTMDQLKTDVNNYYYSNVGTRLDTPPQLQVGLAASTITLTTTLVVPTYFLGIIGIHHLDFNIKSQATLAFGTLEVAMVLDNSGSMNTNNNIATLRTAAGNLVNTIYNLGATSTKPEPVKMGMVPFAGAVNVGPAFQNDATATWLDKNAVGTYNTAKVFDLLAGLTTDKSNSAVTWGGCVEARQQPYDVNDTPATVATPATLYVPMFAPDEPDNWTCSTSSCSNIGSSNSTRKYNGAPRDSQSYNNYLPDACGSVVTMTRANPGVITLANHLLAVGDAVVFNTTGALYTGITAGTTYYVKTAPPNTFTFTISATSGGTAIRTTGSQSGTHTMTSSAQWTCQSVTAACGGAGNGVAETTAMASTCKYGTPANKTTMSPVTIGGIAGGPNFMCNSTAITALTTTKATVTNAINAMQAAGSTNIQEGLMWGWRVLSPDAPFTQGRSYAAGDNQKSLVLMTDGENTYYPQSKYVGSWYAAWGYIVQGHLGTTSTTASVIEGKMNDRTALACTNVKAAGIKVYTVAFTGSGGISATTQTLLQDCASDPSMYYLAANQAALLAAFQAIGDQISLLRISQ